MANYTPNLNLEKPLKTEKYNIDIQNSNMDKIDQGFTSYLADLSDLENVIDSQLNTKDLQKISLNQGVQNINVPQDTVLYSKIGGRTLTNLLGKDGSCEDINKFVSFSTNTVLESDTKNKKYGRKCVKFTWNYEESAIPAFFLPDVFSLINTNKHYLVLGDVKTGNCNSIRVTVDKGDALLNSPSQVNTDYRTSYLKISPSDLSTFTAFKVCGVIQADNGEYGYFDGFRVYEITEEIYSKIDVDPEYTGDKLGEKFPYVDSIQSVRNPYFFNHTNKSYQYFPNIELHSNLDGMVKDEIYYRDGKYWKLNRFKNIVLDGNLNWSFYLNKTDYKIVEINGFPQGITDALNAVASKYDGKILNNVSVINAADEISITSTSQTCISIPNSDSGWEDSHTPTGEEIKAYFAEHPYQLYYQLSSPYEEEVFSEGRVLLSKGENQLEFGTGIQVREKVNPVLSGLYYINIDSIAAPFIQGTELKYRIDTDFGMYVDNLLDTRWYRYGNENSYGKYHLSKTVDQFNPSASHSITYVPLDRHLITCNAVDILGEYSLNIRTTLDEVIKEIQELSVKEYISKKSVDSHLADYVLQTGYATATGSANSYAVSLDPAPVSLVEGLGVAVRINVDNTGASTINVNGKGAKVIKKPNGYDVEPGNLKAGSIYTLRYNGINFILQGEGGGKQVASGSLSVTTTKASSSEVTGVISIRGLTFKPSKVFVGCNSFKISTNCTAFGYMSNDVVKQFGGFLSGSSYAFIVEKGEVTLYVDGFDFNFRTYSLYETAIASTDTWNWYAFE